MFWPMHESKAGLRCSPRDSVKHRVLQARHCYACAASVPWAAIPGCGLRPGERYAAWGDGALAMTLRQNCSNAAPARQPRTTVRWPTAWTTSTQSRPRTTA